jgi:hypothetical protein
VVAEAIIYQMMYMKWIAKERKKKNSGLKRGGGGRKETRDLSLPWILGFVVSIGRFNGFVLSCGRDDKVASLSRPGPRPRPAGDSRGMG